MPPEDEVHMPPEDNELIDAAPLERVGRLVHELKYRLERIRRLLDKQPPYRHFLRDWRTYRGLSQYELAERVGTLAWVVTEWEDGSLEIRLEDQFRLFRALEVTPEQFFSGEGLPYEG